MGVKLVKQSTHSELGINVLHYYDKFCRKNSRQSTRVDVIISNQEQVSPTTTGDNCFRGGGGCKVSRVYMSYPAKQLHSIISLAFHAVIAVLLLCGGRDLWEPDLQFI